MPSLLDTHVGPESIADIQNAYFEDNMPKTWYDAARKYPKSIFASYILAKNRVKDRPRSTKHTFNLKVGSNNSVRATGLFDKLAPPRTDLSTKGEVYWAFQDASFVVDDREPAWGGKAGNLQQFDYLAMQEQDMFDNWFEKNDEWLLSLAAGPNDGSEGHPVFFGLPYWFTPSTTPEFGFNGLNPTGYSNKAGKDVTTTKMKGYRNGTFRTGAMSDLDGLLKMEKANRACSFRSYKKVSPETEPGTDFLIISHPDWFFEYSVYLKTHNDNPGKDGGKYSSGRSTMNGHVFMGVEWIYADQFADQESLAYDSSKPIYGLNLNTIEINTYDGIFMKQGKPIQQSDAPHTYVTLMDTIMAISVASVRQSWRAYST